MTQSTKTLKRERYYEEESCRQETHSRPGLSAFARYADETLRRNWAERDQYYKTVPTVFTNETLSREAST